MSILPLAKWALVGLAIGWVGPVRGQSDAARAQPPVALDQLSSSAVSQNKTSRVADLDVDQPATPLRAAAVISSEVPARADSRSLVAAPLAGRDRCDPADGNPHSAVCRKRIETRASDYSHGRPSPVPPEGRLLLLLNPGGATGGDGAAGRSLAAPSGLNDPNGPAEQIAVALRDQATQDAAAAAAKQSSLPAGVSPIVVVPGR